MRLSGDVLALREVVRRTGINPDQFQTKIAANDGMGGPEIPLDRVQVNGIHDPSFNTAYLQRQCRSGSIERSVLRNAPHSARRCRSRAPVFGRTSGFGARLDPFTGRYAFHPGVDFAGPWGAPVHATAPGPVTFAGNRGGYGNMVEIDNGLGIHTRYGHLSSDHCKGRHEG